MVAPSSPIHSHSWTLPASSAAGIRSPLSSCLALKHTGQTMYLPPHFAETDVTKKAFHYMTIDVVGGVAHAVAKDESGVQFDAVDLTHDW